MDVFGRLMDGLDSQLSGMGVAFGSSLLGLAGSLIVGLLELFAGHGQNRFYRELEEWLSSITRVSFASGEESGGDAPVMAGVIDHLAEQMETLQQMFTQSDISRTVVDEKLGMLVEAIHGMTRQMQQGDPENSTLERVAAGQERLIAHFEAQGAATASMPKAGCGCARSMCRCCVFSKRSPQVVRKAWRNCAAIW